MHERRAGVDGVAQVADRRQRFVIDHDGLGRIFGGEAVLGDHRRDDVADVAHLVGANAGRGAPFIGRPSPNGIGCTTVSSP